MLFVRKHTIGLVSGILVGFLLAAFCAACGLPREAQWCAWTAGVCAVWWITESLPLPATALLPFVVFPLTGVVDEKGVAQSYGHTAILLLMGGFFLSAAMERSDLHRRLALALLNLVGGSSGPRLVFGFMLATSLLSMWVSNSATTLMMLPIAMALLQQCESPKLRMAMLLGIAYSASIGGMATPVGTPPNVLMIANYRELTGKTIDFLSWGRVALPIVIVLLPLTWFLLTRGLKLDRPVTMLPVGRWRSTEKRVLCVFVGTAAAWVFRTAPWGGWAGLVGATDESGRYLVGDATVALGASLALFLIPAGRGHEEDEVTSQGDACQSQESSAFEGLLDWETAARIPWGILLLFGGGLALAKGFETSGLSASIGESLGGLKSWHPYFVVFAVCLLVNFLTELTSSTATTALLLPILAQMALAAELPLELIMVPGTISASCAFMLPVATAPNTIVFGAGGLSSLDMARRGWKLNVLSTLVISLISWLLLR